MTTADDKPARERPTRARIRELEDDLAFARLDVERERRQRADANQTLAAVQTELDAERQRWADLDPQARAIGQIAPVLDQLRRDAGAPLDTYGWERADVEAMNANARAVIAGVLDYLRDRYCTEPAS